MRVASLALFALAAVAARAQTHYHVTDIGPYVPYGIGNDGTVYGRGAGASYVWDTAHGYKAIPATTGQYLIGAVQAQGLNSTGVVVGYQDLLLKRALGNGGGYVVRNAFVWTRQNGTRLLPQFFPFETTEAFGVSDNGYIVGRKLTATAAYGWLVDPNGQLAPLLGLPGATGVDPRLVNSSGVATGYSWNQGIQTAVVWDVAHNVSDLGLPPGKTQVFPNGLNEAGWVAGYSVGDIGQGFLRSPSGAFLLITNPVNSLYWTLAMDVNSNTEVCGTLNIGNQVRRAFYWTEAGGVVLLSDRLEVESAGWVLEEALGINDSGQICCKARFNGGELRAALLDPVP